MWNKVIRNGALALVATVVVAGCGNSDRPFDFDAGVPAPDSGIHPDASVTIDGGEADGGLANDAGIQGQPCQITVTCPSGEYCGPNRVCEAAGSAAEGERCATTADCQAGLVCNPEGLLSKCRAGGSGGPATSCNGPTDCVAGLWCIPVSGGSQCLSVLPPDGGFPTGTFPPIPNWPGSNCTAEDGGVPRAYFEVPRTTTTTDFYRLPFPNDIRRTGAGLDLSRHPRVGNLLPVDILGRVITASEQDLQGFGTNPVVYFRFSERYDWDSVGGDPARMHFVDITPTSPTYGLTTSLFWVVTYGPISRYICNDWLALRPAHGVPLRPGTTYAAYLTTGIVPLSGGSFERSPDLVALLADSVPGDADLVGPHQKYAPLRAYLSDKAIDPATVLNAAVFTTHDPEPPLMKLRAQVRTTAPTVSDLTLCEAGTTSPCDDGSAIRGCSAPDSRFAEIHGRLSVPVFQSGTPPYQSSGGEIGYDVSGNPVVARMENVCFALSVPRGVAPPAEGFPLLVYEYGTGGSFTAAVRNGLAADLADTTAGGAPLRAATLTLELPQHGARRGGSTSPPEELFFNYANPRAVHGNILQGAADLFTLAHWAAGYSVVASSSPTGQDIRFDTTRLTVFAHSQGATHAQLAIPFEPTIEAAVLSGGGGDLAQSLLSKTQPFDIAAALPYALLDGSVNPATGRPQLSGGDYNPALSLIQAYFDPVDPVNFARRLRLEPIAGGDGLHVMMTYGLGDSYSPVTTLQSYARAAGMVHVRPVLEDFGLPQADAPLAANLTVGATPRTFGMRQYQPSAGMDGHFVSTDSGAGRTDVLRFLRAALSGASNPPIGGP